MGGMAGGLLQPFFIIFFECEQEFKEMVKEKTQKQRPQKPHGKVGDARFAEKKQEQGEKTVSSQQGGVFSDDFFPDLVF